MRKSQRCRLTNVPYSARVCWRRRDQARFILSSCVVPTELQHICAELDNLVELTVDDIGMDDGVLEHNIPTRQLSTPAGHGVVFTVLFAVTASL